MTPIEPPSFEPLVNIAQAGFSGSVLPFLSVGILLFCSAFISGSEAAFFSLSPQDKEDLRNDDSRTSQTVLQLLARPKGLLATILVVNNFVNVGIVILSSSIVDSFFVDVHGHDLFRFLIEIVAITLLLLLIGEVIPKIYATKNAKKFSQMAAIPVKVMSQLPPFSWIKSFLVNGSNIISKRAKRKGIKISSGELEAALALTKEDNTSEEEHKILEGIVKFGNTDVRQIMKPRMDVIAIDETFNFIQVMEVILESGYSRIPVYENSFDYVKGILFIKDLLPNLNKDENFKWNELIRKPFFVPENKKIDDLLKEFQEKKVHMAVVVDEYGGSSGIITLEDVLEEIVGDITDEFDDVEVIYTKIDEHTYLFEGRTSLVDFYKVTDIDSKEFENTKGDAETLGGFIVEQAGKILKNNEFIICDNIKLVVESSDKKRIKMVKAILTPKTNDEINN